MLLSIGIIVSYISFFLSEDKFHVNLKLFYYFKGTVKTVPNFSVTCDLKDKILICLF
jgi:hypothetical protein